MSEFIAFKAGLEGFNGDLNRPDLELTKTNKAAFLMNEFYFDNLTLKAGYRYEEIEFSKKDAENEKDFLHGAELGLNYTLNKTSSLFANYSRSYQSASLDRLFSFFTGTFVGYVEPSQANNYTLGYSNIRTYNKFKIAAFYIDLQNEIYYYSDPTYVNSKNTNIDKSHKYGIDLYDKYIINDAFNIAFNYNYVQAIIGEEKENGEDYSGNKLPGVSDHNIKATFSYLPTKELTLSLIEVYRSEAYAANDFENNFTQKQDPYNTTDISVTYAKKDFEVFAKINNIFNQANGLWIQDDAIYPVNFTTTAIAGLKLKF